MSDNFNFYDHTTLRLFDLFENDKVYNKRPQQDAEGVILLLSAFADVLARVPYLTRHSSRLRGFVTAVRDLNEHMARQYRDLPTNLSLMTSYVQEMRGLRNTDALLRVRGTQDHARVASASSYGASAELSAKRLMAAPPARRGTTVEDAVALGAETVDQYANLIGGAVAVPGTPGWGNAKDNGLCGSLDAAFGSVAGHGSSLMQGIMPPLASAILLVGSVIGTGASLIGPKVEGYGADDPLATLALGALARNPRALGSVGQFVDCLQSFGYAVAGLLEADQPLNPAHLILSGTPGGYHAYDASGGPHRLTSFDYEAFRLEGVPDGMRLKRVVAAIRDLLDRIAVLERLRVERETTKSAMLDEIAKAEAAIADLEDRYAAYDGAIPTEMFAELNGFGNFAAAAAAHLACVGRMIETQARVPSAALPEDVAVDLYGRLGENLGALAGAASRMRLGRLAQSEGALNALSTTLARLRDEGVLAILAPIDHQMPQFNEAVEAALAPVGALIGGLQNMMLSESGTIAKATTRLTILTNVITLPVLAKNTCAAPLIGRLASAAMLDALGLDQSGEPAPTAPETPVVPQPAPWTPPVPPSPMPVQGDEPLLPSAPKPAKKGRDKRFGADQLKSPISVSKPPKF